MYGQTSADGPLSFEAFDWDEGNLDKCAKHGLTQREVEAVLSGAALVAPDLAHSALEDRFYAIGRARGRPVFVVFTRRRRDGADLIRPISARFMHAKEAARHAENSSPF